MRCNERLVNHKNFALFFMSFYSTYALNYVAFLYVNLPLKIVLEFILLVSMIRTSSEGR